MISAFHLICPFTFPFRVLLSFPSHQPPLQPHTRRFFFFFIFLPVSTSSTLSLSIRSFPSTIYSPSFLEERRASKRFVLSSPFFSFRTPPIFVTSDPSNFSSLTLRTSLSPSLPAFPRRSGLTSRPFFHRPFRTAPPSGPFVTRLETSLYVCICSTAMYSARYFFFFLLPFISLLLFNFSNFPLRMVVVFTVFTYEVVFFFHWFLSGGTLKVGAFSIFNAVLSDLDSEFKEKLNTRKYSFRTRLFLCN